MFQTVEELVKRCETEDKAIHEIMLEQEMDVTGATAEEVYAGCRIILKRWKMP